MATAHSSPDGAAAFQFQTVPTILSQPGGAAHFGPLLTERFSAKSVLVVTDAGVRAAGLLGAPLASLSKAGLSVSVFDDVVADPPEAVVLAAVEAGRAAGADLVVGLGGGSPMDTAKIVACALVSDQPLSAMYGVGAVTGGRAPLVLVPTTSGTGSEVTNIAIVTTGETTKMGVVAPQLYADFAFLDADLTLGLPPHVTAATGIDAMVHALEAYTTKLKKNPISDALAVEALSLLSLHLETAVKDGANREARAACQLGAMLAGQAFSNAPCAGVHALAYPIGGIFHIPHGLSNTLVLPHVLRFTAPVAGDLYGELAPVIGASDETADAFIERLEEIADACGVERRLRDVGISHNELPRMAQDAMLQTRLLQNNRREIDEAAALRIYEEAW